MRYSRRTCSLGCAPSPEAALGAKERVPMAIKSCLDSVRLLVVLGTWVASEVVPACLHN